MDTTRLGESDLQVSKICLGTMTFGEQNTEAEAHQQLDYSLERGINFIDTAEMYPVMPRVETQGTTERFIGSWLKQAGNRQKVVLATKIAGPSTMASWIRNGQNNFDRQNIRAAVEDSLRRLQTDYIDLYNYIGLAAMHRFLVSCFLIRSERERISRSRKRWLR
jgi:aryl-alcohol dehydrogenase-like predicted oxidoreductase